MNAITAGSEIDAWCTKCKLDLNHRIIAMAGPKIVRVECLTCRGHHAYRRPKSAKPEPKKRAASTGKRASAAKKPRAGSAGSIKQQWEQAVLGRTDAEFTKYTISSLFKTGQLVRHKKFGDGVVSELLEEGKVTMIFEAGEKKLVHGREL